MLKQILLETNTELLLCDQDFEAFQDIELPTINITETDWSCVNVQEVHKTTIDFPKINPKSPLWLVYSSGTTGKHKGISISHQAMLASYNTRYAIKDYDAKSQLGCNIYYLWEVFRPLLRGGTVHIINDDILHNFSLLAETIEKYGGVSNVLLGLKLYKFIDVQLERFFGSLQESLLLTVPACKC